MNAKTSIEILRREFKTVDKSLGIKPILIDFANEIADFIEQQEQRLRGSHDRERVLQEQVVGLTKAKNTFYNDLVMYKNSSDTLVTLKEQLYEDVEGYKARERVLREALVSIKKELQEYCDGVLVYSTAFEIAMPIIDKALEESK